MNTSLMAATIADYPLIQNMARFYVYDLSRECGFISPDWALPSVGLYESFDFKEYFQNLTRRAYLIKVDQETAGFVLLNQEGIFPETNWNMGEFFILAKFQGKGIGSEVARQVWDLHPGNWEVSVIPENKSAATFWRRLIENYTKQTFKESLQYIEYDQDQPYAYYFSVFSGLIFERLN